MVSLAILAVLALGLFITTVISVAKVQRLTREKESAESNLAQAISASQMNDDWERLKQEAGGDGVVPYLSGQMRSVNRLVTGNARSTLDEEQLRSLLGLDENAPVKPLIPMIRDMRDELAAAESSRSSAEQSAATARRDYEEARNSIGALQDSHDRTIEALTGQIDTLQAEVDDLRQGFEEGVEFAQADKDDAINDYKAKLTSAETVKQQLNERVQTLEDLVARLRGDTERSSLRPGAEDALVDGTVVNVTPATNEVYLSRGRREKVVLGMTFEVYPIGTTIVRDIDGEYPAGKATIEVIRIDQTSSVARVIRQSRGNPVVVGDVIANAVYDPNKTYTFVVYGNFDTNDDFVATAQEANEIRGIINEWGGTVENDISGNTDFVVLGRRPILPPQPKLDDPPAIVSRYQMLVRQQREYDRLFQTASSTSIPVLNQNRLFTLTGLYADR